MSKANVKLADQYDMTDLGPDEDPEKVAAYMGVAAKPSSPDSSSDNVAIALRM